MEFIEGGTSADDHKTIESDYLGVDSDFKDAEDDESEEDMQVDINGSAPKYLQNITLHPNVAFHTGGSESASVKDRDEDGSGDIDEADNGDEDGSDNGK